MMNGRESVFEGGHDTLGGKTKFRVRERRGRLRFRLRRRVARTRTGRARWSSRVAASTTPLRRGPRPPGSEPICPGCVVLPEAIPRCPRQKGMTVLPPIFDTIPDLGATKLRAAFLYPFLHLRERFDTLAVVAVFSPFWAGKAPRRDKIACIV